MKFTLIVAPGGKARHILDEAVDLSELGRGLPRRASTVDADGQGLWWADLGMSGGPKLGPFDKRSQALVAEIEWLLKHNLPEPKGADRESGPPGHP